MLIGFLDVETTGLNCRDNDILDLALIVDDSEKNESQVFQQQMSPPRGASVNQEALAINGYTEEEIWNLPPLGSAVSNLVSFLGGLKEVSPLNVILSGFRVRFDYDFLRESFRKAGSSDFSKFFSICYWDVSATVERMRKQGTLKTVNGKLMTVCSAFDIPIKPHDAMEDCKAVRSLFYRLLDQHQFPNYPKDLRNKFDVSTIVSC